MFERAELDERRSPIFDWILRSAIGIVYIVLGWEKFTDARWVSFFQQVGFGQWFRYVTGVTEVVGGALLFLPWTATVGLAMLICTMLGAVLIVAVVLGDPGDMIFPGIFLAGLIAFWTSRRRSA